VAVLEDLFFTVKINEAAKQAGLAIVFVKSEKDAMDRAKTSPVAILIDLNCQCVDALALIGKLKSSEETTGISLIGYLSHVQGELKQKAQAAGCDMVLPRSAFSQNLPQLLKRYAGTL
jgi:CheY-like chemotaxis protein